MNTFNDFNAAPQTFTPLRNKPHSLPPTHSGTKASSVRAVTNTADANIHSEARLASRADRFGAALRHAKAAEAGNNGKMPDRSLTAASPSPMSSSVDELNSMGDEADDDTVQLHAGNQPIQGMYTSAIT